MEHVCEPAEGRQLFCACGKLVDRDSLRGVRFLGFHGDQSTTPSVEAFWNTGDPGYLAPVGAEDHLAA